jgi:hypothetical protein
MMSVNGVKDMLNLFITRRHRRPVILLRKEKRNVAAVPLPASF